MIQKLAAEATELAHQELAKTLPLADTADFADADRGFLGSCAPGAVHAAGRCGS